jgi:hypothetical protein
MNLWNILQNILQKTFNNSCNEGFRGCQFAKIRETGVIKITHNMLAGVFFRNKLQQ